MNEINGVKVEWFEGNAYVRLNEYEKQVTTHEEIMELNLHKEVEKVLAKAKGLLYEIDSEIDKMEGEEIYDAMMKVQEHLLQWNLLGHNFVNQGIYGWVESDDQDELGK